MQQYLFFLSLPGCSSPFELLIGLSAQLVTAPLLCISYYDQSHLTATTPYSMLPSAYTTRVEPANDSFRLRKLYRNIPCSTENLTKASLQPEPVVRR